MDKILKSGGRIGGFSDVSLGGITGGGAFGCFDFNNCQMESLLGAIPEEFKTWQALPYNPFLACLMDDWMLLSESLVWVWYALDDSC